MHPFAWQYAVYCEKTPIRTRKIKNSFLPSKAHGDALTAKNLTATYRVDDRFGVFTPTHTIFSTFLLI